MTDWKEKLDPLVRDYLNDILKEVMKYREAYLKSKNPKVSQLWVAIAILLRKIKLLEKELESLKEEKEKKEFVEKTLSKY